MITPPGFIIVFMVMRLSLLCPTYPKSGQVGDFVGGLYQDLSRGLGICTMSFGSLVNQTPIPQRWVYCITSTRKEGLGILGTNPWHSGIFTSRKRNAIFYRKTFCCTSFEFYVLFMILNYSFGLHWLKAINEVPKCSKIWNT